LGLEEENLKTIIVLAESGEVARGTTCRSVKYDADAEKVSDEYLSFLKSKGVDQLIDPEGYAYYVAADGATSRTPPLAFAPETIDVPPPPPVVDEVDKQEESILPHADEAWSCPACRGRHKAHTRSIGCRLQGHALPGADARCPACRGQHAPHSRLRGCRLYQDPKAKALALDDDSGATAVQFSNRDVVKSEGRDREEWKAAAQKEYDSLVTETQALKPISKEESRRLLRDGAEYIPMMEVWTKKAADETGIRKKKCRGVLLGNRSNQKPQHLSSQTTDGNGLKTILALAGGYRLHLSRIDIKTAFLNAAMPPSMKPIITSLGKGMASLLGLEQQDYVVEGAQNGHPISPRCWGIERDRSMRKFS
jgi:hypothetical protein